MRELSVDTCLELLADNGVGRIAINDERGPVVFPVNYVLDRGAVVFRTADTPMLDAAGTGEPATFEVDGVDEERGLGWSVLVRGTLEEISDPAELQRLRQLSLEPFAAGDRHHYLQIVSRRITGRRIPFPDTIPESWRSVPSVGNVWVGRDGDDLLG